MSLSLGWRPCRFSLDEIKVATNNFDEENLLGTGGEGKVYKGHIRIDDGITDVTVAIKCLTSKSRERKFEKEIQLVSSLHHSNLVSLRGYCQELNHKILVYEYIHNGSLAKNLYPTCSLSWSQLLNICIGTARGLDYLHHGASAIHTIVHRDVKPSNILLDENWGAKLSDFGLSKRGLLSNHHDSDPIKTDLRGTFGYYAPEYVFNKEVSRKTDAYAFGVVLLEVLCRKKRGWPLHDESSSDSNMEEAGAKDDDIGEWARKNIATDLKHQMSIKCLDYFIDIARRCLLRDPKQRPNMTYVVSMLLWSLQSLKNNEAAAKYKDSLGKKAGLPPLPKPTQANPKVSASKAARTKDRDRAVLYYSSYNPTSKKIEKSAEDSLLVRMILKALLRVNVDERNRSKHDAYRLEHGQKVDNELCLPHLFIGRKFVGVDVFIQLYKAGKLASLLGGSPITLNCDCGDAMSCHICVPSSRFVVCKVCDTLTMLPMEEKGQLRYCPNCQSNQLFLRTLILTTEGDVYLQGISLSSAQHFKGGFNVRARDTSPEGIPVSLVHYLELAIALIMLILALCLLYWVQSKDQSVQSNSLASWLRPMFNHRLDFLGTLLERLLYFGQHLKRLVVFAINVGKLILSQTGASISIWVCIFCFIGFVVVVKKIIIDCILPMLSKFWY